MHVLQLCLHPNFSLVRAIAYHPASTQEMLVWSDHLLHAVCYYPGIAVAKIRHLAQADLVILLGAKKKDWWKISSFKPTAKSFFDSHCFQPTH